MNDTTRELGGTLGVAIIGSVFSSLYIGSLDSAGGVFGSLPPELQDATSESVGRGPGDRRRARRRCPGRSSPR